MKARLMQREDFGVKIKLSYTVTSSQASNVEACIECDTAASTGDNIVVGNYCGGYPNGCAVLRISEPFAWVWTKETFSVRTRVDGSAWSEPVSFRVDKTAKGVMGASHLERVITH